MLNSRLPVSLSGIEQEKLALEEMNHELFEKQEMQVERLARMERQMRETQRAQMAKEEEAAAAAELLAEFERQKAELARTKEALAATNQQLHTVHDVCCPLTRVPKALHSSPLGLCRSCCCKRARASGSLRSGSGWKPPSTHHQSLSRRCCLSPR